MKNALREYRTDADLSQADLAAAVDVSRQTINSIERERYDPSLELALKLANYFDCLVEDLFELDESD
jgi:putative transcriptional regulator